MKKKFLAIVLALGVILITPLYIISYSISAKSEENIKLMVYTPPTIAGENGYQIDKYENIENKEWLNSNEVLSITKKDELKNPDSTTSISYCSIYNLNTNKSKDFKDVNISTFLGMSPNKKYVLYSEPKSIIKSGSEEAEKAYKFEEVFNYNFKILNLDTGEIKDINTEKCDHYAQLKWIGNNKIFQNCNSEVWQITDISGNVYAQGNYNEDGVGRPDIVGTDDIKDLGNSVEGKFYYINYIKGKSGSRLCSLDIKTKETKILWENEKFFNAYKKGKIILIDNVLDKHQIIMDESGNTIRTIDLPEGIQDFDYKLSPDGSKVAYRELPDNDLSNEILKVMDIKTGEVKEIIKSSIFKSENGEGKTTVSSKDNLKVLVGKQIDNICWENDGKDLSFTYGNSNANELPINTYIVSFEK